MSEEAMAAAAAAPAPEAGSEPAAHSFETVDDAYAALQDARQEAAGYRTKYAPFRDAFDGLDDGTVEFVLQSVVGLKQGTTEGVTQWLDAGQRMAKEDEFNAWLEGKAPKPAAAPTPPTEEAQPTSPNEPVDVTALVQQAVGAAMQQMQVQQQQSAQEAQVNERASALQAEAEGLGYEAGSAPYRALFDIAIDKGVGLAEAHAELRASFGLEATPPPGVPATSGTPATGAVTPADGGEKVSARESVEARIKAASMLPG